MSLFWLIVIGLLLYYIAAPIFRVWRKVRQFQDEYRRTMSGMGDSTTSQGQQPQQDDANQDMMERYRRYSDATAENVEFEELEGHIDEEPPTPEPPLSEPTRYQQEEISDAEFEEIV